MNNLSQILNSATMGQPRRLRPLIGWTVAEYFFRGAPYGAMLLVVWEVFKPLQNPGTPLNLVNIGWACLMLLISLVCLWLISKKAYLVAYKDGYDICCDGRLEVVNHLRQLPMSFFNSRDPGDIGAYIVSDYNNVEMLTTHLIGQFFGGLAIYYELENDLDKLEGQTWVSWNLESEKDAPGINEPEISELFDLLISAPPDREGKQHLLLSLCRNYVNNR